jgi:hypothetical protein
LFSTFVEKLESLLGKTFLISSFFPLVLAILANFAVIIYASERETRKDLLTSATFWLSKPAVDILLLGLVACSAYLLSPLNLPMREFLEGKYFPLFLSERMQSNQYRNLLRLNGRLEEAATRRHWLARREEMWQRLMRRARRVGNTVRVCYFDETGNCARKIKRLNRMRFRGRQIPIKDLEDAAEHLYWKLKLNSADLNSSYSCVHLDRAVKDFAEIVQYCSSRAETEYIDLFNDRQFNYPESSLAPTLMGNIFRSVGTYAERRYKFSLDIFWTKLQKIAQQDAKYYQVLQDAKTQLDFLVALIWMSGISMAGWTVYSCWLIYTQSARPLLLNTGVYALIASIGTGIALVLLLYLVSLQNYRAFADVLRSCIDFYRFGILDSMHIALPSSIEEEHELWGKLAQLTGYGELQRGLSYLHPKREEPKVTPGSIDPGSGQH